MLSFATGSAGCASNACAKSRGRSAGADERYRQRLLELRDSPIAIHTEAANAQHYELPPEFFEGCLGQRLKYSCAYYPRGDETLDQAEEAMLGLYGERAELADGQEILELGCGWGSLTLWMAERFPNARITAVSNSRPQRSYIEAQCRPRGIANVPVITADVNPLELGPREFDRCVSVEMFEHMRNYEHLLARIAGWLRPEGKLFVHIFAHRTLMYPFETEGKTTGWAGTSSPAASCPRRHTVELPATSAYGGALAARRHALPAHRQRWLESQDRWRAQSWRCCADLWPQTRGSGSSAGASSGWPARSCSAMATAANGCWRITASCG